MKYEALQITVISLTNKIIKLFEFSMLYLLLGTSCLDQSRFDLIR